jgi:hypothetical protein
LGLPILSTLLLKESKERFQIFYLIIGIWMMGLYVHLLKVSTQLYQSLNLQEGTSLLFIPADSDDSNNPFPSDISITRDGFDLLESAVGPHLNVIPPFQRDNPKYVILSLSAFRLAGFPNGSFTSEILPIFLHFS